MILVTGATGTTGSEIVRQLGRAGAGGVRVMLRDAARAAAIEASGFEVVKGDFDDRPSLDAALAGVTKALLLPPPDPQMVERQSRFLEAAKRAGVRHIVKLSAINADASAAVGFSKWHGLSEQELKNSGLDWTMLQPNFFMQNLLGSADSIRAQGVFYQPVGDARASFVDARDVAAVAARVLTGDGHEGKSYVITGPEALSFSEVADKLSAATNSRVTYVSVSPEDFQERLLGAGLPEWLADALGMLNEMLAAGRAAAVNNVVRDVGETEPITFGQFARDYAQAFRAAPASEPNAIGGGKAE